VEPDPDTSKKELFINIFFISKLKVTGTYWPKYFPVIAVVAF
jgi:hypothetical protein